MYIYIHISVEPPLQALLHPAGGQESAKWSDDEAEAPASEAKTEQAPTAEVAVCKIYFKRLGLF